MDNKVLWSDSLYIFYFFIRHQAWRYTRWFPLNECLHSVFQLILCEKIDNLTYVKVRRIQNELWNLNKKRLVYVRYVPTRSVVYAGVYMYLASYS